MYIIYDYWLHDEDWIVSVVRSEITYPPYALKCNESVWMVPGTFTL